MSKCQFCGLEIEAWDKDLAGHMIITKDTSEEGHIHVHGPLADAPLLKEMLDNAIDECDLKNHFSGGAALFDRKEVVFHNRQRIGDMLVFTSAVRDFKKAYPDVRVNVIATAMHIWDHNPYIDRTLVATEQNTVKIGPGKLTNSSNRLDWHFTNAFRVSMEDNLKIKIQQGMSRPDIWLTEEEYNAPRITEKPYWIICIGGEKGWGCKMYPFERWQEFVSQNPDVLFYQIGASGDAHPRLQGANVVDYVGKTESRETGVRDLFKLFLNAEGSIGLVSFHMHLSGALTKPCIVVAGAREPVSFTRYAGHQYLATDGCLPCAITACWHCDIKACSALVEYPDAVEPLDRKVPKCVDMITPEDLTRALRSYYYGGRLKKGVASAKPKFANVVKTPIKTVAPEVAIKPVEDYGLPFNAGTITVEDAEFLKDTVKENNVKTVLEFGAGLSTLMFNALGLKVITYEDKPGWIEKIKSINPKCDIRLWNGEEFEMPEKFDFAFVDGPSGGINREFSTKMASESANIVVIHDASRKEEMQWQEKYLKGKFSGPGGGGRRCHLWSKVLGTKIAFRTGSPLMDGTQVIAEKVSPVVIDPSAKLVKFVSTARGWGGCARSITTIMGQLLAQGYDVEFIPFRNSIGSKEFKECLAKELKGVRVTTSYDTLKEACDVLLVYADDYVWEFNQPAIVDAFSDLHATKKIMMLNYRRGNVGQIEWTRNWDKYMFLNSAQQTEFLKAHGAKYSGHTDGRSQCSHATKVLPPCTDLTPFFDVVPDFSNNIRIVRHSSQGDTKFEHIEGADIYHQPFYSEVDRILNTRNDVEIYMLPGPSFIPNEYMNRFHKVMRTASATEIASFLQKGTLFWYSLPKGYMDMGPRVIVEAMAAGLPIIADNWGGAVDRVTPECGWLCDTKEQMIEIIKNVTLEELKEKGQAARERAKSFTTESWIKEIMHE